MAFRSVQQVFESLEQQAAWQAHQQFQQLLASWSRAVGLAVSAQTRPLKVRQQVLYVATSSAAWAQTLTFERKRILAKLNPMLPEPLVDIRFSTAQWSRPEQSDAGQSETTDVWNHHPSRIAPNASLIPQQTIQPPESPTAAFEHWARLVKGRSHHLPQCPCCHCPTPEGELQRWSVCACCAAKQFSHRT
jgi:predicted nucleic acid-binding Zn ribbon protein